MNQLQYELSVADASQMADEVIVNGWPGSTRGVGRDYGGDAAAAKHYWIVITTLVLCLAVVRAFNFLRYALR